MSDPAAPVARAANRKTAPSEPAQFSIDVGSGFTVIVTAAGDTPPSVRELKNGLERGTRVARKALAAGITDASQFLALLSAIAEAERLKKATREARDRVKTLVERPAESPIAPPAEASPASAL